MRLIRNMHAIGRLSLLILMLTSAVIGGLLSYLWVTGYYESLKIQVGPALSITNAMFPLQDTYHFNVTILHPTHSNITGAADITQITVSTLRDGIVHNVTKVIPSLDTPLQKGASQNFKCSWNWANYTGETVRIDVSVAEGSGGSREFETPRVNLRIPEVDFNSTIGVTCFNVTVENDAISETYVNVTGIAVTANEIIQNVTETTPLPWALNPGNTQDFKCVWNWTDYQNTSVTVAVHTLQGYMNYTIQTTPFPVTLSVTEILFNIANTSYFSVNVTNNEASPTYVNITRIAVAIENLTVQEWTVENGTYVEPAIPYTLNSSSSVIFVCPWNWTEHRDKNVAIIIETLQGFKAQRVQVTPPPVVLNITYVGFNPTDTNHFNITVQNSEFSLEGANTTVTEIHVTVENVIVAKLMDDMVPSLPLTLGWNESRPLNCSWSWGMHVGKNVTIVVQTVQGYSCHSDPVTLVALVITDVVFNPVDTDHFLLTVKNPGLPLSPLDITVITATVEGELHQILDALPFLPFVLPSGADITFMCSWNWSASSGKDALIIAETSEGYEAAYTCKIP